MNEFPPPSPWSAPAAPNPALSDTTVHDVTIVASAPVPEYIAAPASTSNRSGRRTAAALVGAAALVLGGIGAFAATRTSRAAKQPIALSLRKAAQQTEAAKTVHVETNVTTTGGPAGDGAGPIKVSGDLDLTNGRARLTTDLSNVFGSGDLGAILGDDEASTLTMEIIVDGKVAYLRSPFFGKLVGAANNKWVRIPGDGTDSILGSGAGSNPANSLGLFEGIADDKVQNLGTVDVDGVSTTHYRAELTTQDLVAGIKGANVPADKQAEISAMLDDAAGPVTIEAWVDTNNMIRRQVVDMTTSGAHVVAETRYSRFGEPVTITAPAAGDVVDLAGIGDLQGAPFGT
jgi:hypothetical protein